MSDYVSNRTVFHKVFDRCLAVLLYSDTGYALIAYSIIIDVSDIGQ